MRGGGKGVCGGVWGWTWAWHQGTGDIPHSKQRGPEREPPRIHSNQNVKFTEQRKYTKNLKDKDHVIYKYMFIILTPNSSVETLKVGRAWMDVQQTLKDHRCQSRLLHPVKLSIITDGERKTLYDKKNLISVHQASSSEATRRKTWVWRG